MVIGYGCAGESGLLFTMPATTVLIADDDPVTLRLLSASLHHEGYQVITAMDAMQVIMMAHRSSPAVIILDIMMPAGNGLDVIKRVKANNQTQLIPVIAISSSSDASLPAQAVALGAEAFFPKPVDLAQLNERLRLLLNSAVAPT